MPSAYRRRYSSNGQTKRCAAFTIEAKIGDVYARLPGYSDKRASLEMARKVEKLAALRESGEQPDTALSKWLAGVSGKLRKRLGKLGLLVGTTEAATLPVGAHLDEYRRALIDGGATESHANLTRNRIKSILDGIGAARLPT